MKVLALVGSPREGGNSDLLAEKSLAGATSMGADTEKIMVGNLNFKPCQGCMECRVTGKCQIEDQVISLVSKIAEADGLVVATPVYGNHLPGHFKMLFDRLVGVMHHIKVTKDGKLQVTSRLPKKVRSVVLIAVAAAHRIDSCQQSLQFLSRIFSAETNGGAIKELRATGLGAKGQVIMDEEEIAAIARAQGLPDPEARAKQMKIRNDRYLQEAYNLGVGLVL